MVINNQGNLNVGDEVWECVPEVSVVPEDVIGEERRDDWTTGGRIEHQDQNTHIYTYTVDKKKKS